MKRIPLIFIILLATQGPARAQSPAPLPDTAAGTLASEQDELLQSQRRAAEKNESIRILEQQELQYDYGNRNTTSQGSNLLIGRDRAQTMMRTLQDEQFRKALSRVTAKGKQVLDENKAFQTPLMVIAGAASFWFGATVRLFKGESLLITSRVEGRNRRAEFTLQSPILNSRLYFEGATGINLNINRSIASINSTAEVNFIGRTNSFSTELRRPLAPHLDFSIGASQIPELNNRTDGRAKIEYQFNF